MTCGCSQPPPTDASTKAAMCQTCPRSIKHRGSAVECTVLGQPLSKIVYSTDGCPLGRFDTANQIRWAGTQWIGVPEPLRWRLTWQLGRVPRNLDGCGCIKAIKGSRIGPWLESWFEGITLLRNRFGEFLTEFHAIR